MQILLKIKEKLSNFFEEEKFRNNILVKLSVGLVILLFGILIFPHPDYFEYQYSVGSIWLEKDLDAPFSFPIYKDLKQYEQEKREAIKSVYPVFQRKVNINRECIDSLKTTINLLQNILNHFNRWAKTHDETDSTKYTELSKALPFSLTANELEYFNKKGKNADAVMQKIENTIASALDEVFSKGIIDKDKSKQLHSTIAVRERISEELLHYENILDLQEAFDIIGSKISTTLGTNIESEVAMKICKAVLRPNLVYDQNATDMSIKIAIENIPRTMGYVLANEKIISRNEIVTEEAKLKLDSYRRAKYDLGINSDRWKHWLGSGLHISIILGLFTLYLYFFRKKIFHDNVMLMLIGIIILFEFVLAYFSLIIQSQEPFQYLILVPVASMLVTIIFDSRVAFYGTVTIAFLIGGIRGNDYALTLSSIMAGGLAAYSVRDIRNRTQIFRSMIYIFIGYGISIIGLSFEQLDKPHEIFTKISFSLANSILSPILAYALLIFFERVFRVTTDLTLSELSDLNHPLLQELSEKTPGTFNHSVIIGNLAEAAAEAIGANAILAKVGGYYHDIGKMNKPEYFVENQVGPHSRHSRLKPRMSALIIASHVKEGIELGREKGLPEVVLDFIPQHHGTTRISYFYDKALKQAAKRPPKDEIREEDFLYPGPKPQTKEAGIVMLADSIEAATRTLTDLTPQKLETAIDNMIKHRFMDGQLDECDLTLRDLTKIKDAFLKILLGTHHQRIQYPEVQTSESTQFDEKIEQPVEVSPQTNEQSISKESEPVMSQSINETQPEMKKEESLDLEESKDESNQNP